MKPLIQLILRRLGWRLSRLEAISPDVGPDAFFPLLKKLGFLPKTIIDVGANHGNWTRTAVQNFPDARYILLEPQDHLKCHVQDLIDQGYQLTWINAGASDEPGNLLFNVAARDDGSSFVPLGGAVEPQSQITVAVTTINEVVASRALPVPDMIKIDAEGFDLKALAGASDLYGKTEIFLLEAVVCVSGYDNSATEIIRRMDAAGYRLMDITDLNRSPRSRALWFCEMAFIRRDSLLLERIGSYL